jgi:hypothetical protein
MFSRKKKNQETSVTNVNKETSVRNVNAKLSQSEVEKILRTVPRDEAFYFYEEVGKPVGYIARSLVDFRDKVNAVRWSSLVFHLKRKDFENWISEILGDSELAKRISNISPDDFNLKNKLFMAIDKRINELKEKPLAPTVVSEDLFVAPRLSETELSK